MRVHSVAGPTRMADLSIESIFSPEIIADPYPMYRQLREGSPVLELPDANMVILSRYRDVQAALRNKKLGHGTDPRMSKEEVDEMMSNPAIANLRRTMLLQNPPDHTRLRGLVVKAFDARRVEAMRVRIRAIADELVDGFIEEGSGDLVRLFIHPLPVIVICVLLGVPNADRAEFVQGTRISGRLIDPRPMTPEELAEANRSTEDSKAYFSNLCDLRRTDPGRPGNGLSRERNRTRQAYLGRIDEQHRAVIRGRPRNHRQPHGKCAARPVPSARSA